MSWGCRFGATTLVVLGAAIAPAAEPAPLPFAIGSSDLDAPMRQQLDDIAAQMRAQPTSRWFVEGHADTPGGDELNRSVSKDRAERVAAALVRRGVDPAQFEVRALGATQPVASNATPEGRAENRRVIVRRRDVADREPPRERAAAIPPSRDDTKPPAPARAPVDVARPTEAPRAEAPPAAMPPAESTPTEVAGIEPTKTAPIDTPPPATAPFADVAPAPLASEQTPAGPADAPRRTQALGVAQAPSGITSPPVVARSVADADNSSPGRGRFWLAVGTSSLAVVAAGVATGFLVDAAVGGRAAAAAQTQLARTDLRPESRGAYERRLDSVNAAVSSDQIGAAVAGAVAVTAAITATILWISEARTNNQKVSPTTYPPSVEGLP